MLRQTIACIILSSVPLLSPAQSWVETLATGEGEIEVYWRDIPPFIYFNEDQEMDGIEYKLMLLFENYVESTYEIDLEIKWTQPPTFPDIIEEISSSEVANRFGIAAVSITDDRKEIMDFSASYLADIVVVVSSEGTEIVETYDQFSDLLRPMEAVTFSGSNNERLLFELRENLGIDFDIMYIDRGAEVQNYIKQSDSRFGYIDLPFYLLKVQEGFNLTRQNLFVQVGEGYSIMIPKSSDWKPVLDEFLVARSDEIQGLVEDYLGPEVFDLMSDLMGQSEVSTAILTKEKELQLALIRNANLRLQEEERLTKILFIGITIVLIFFAVVGKLYYNNRKTTKLLVEQNHKIEKQQEDIEHTNELLVDRNAQLMTLNEEKNNLVRILAHDLRSPLNQIIGLTDILVERKKGTDGDDMQFLSRINEGGRHLSDLINKILNEQSLKDGQEIIQLEKVAVCEVMEDIEERYQTLATKKGIHLVVVGCDQNCFLETDPLLLLLILENLISNAIKFSPAETEVKMTCDDKEDSIVFQVIDQGPGFSEEDKELMFNRFQRLSAQPTGGEPSTGLGLSIVKKYVSDLKGKVWIESQMGEGTTFFVSIPKG